MADVNKTISLNYEAKTDKIKSALKQIPAATDQEFKKASKAIDRAMKKAEKVSARAAKKSKKSWQEFGKGMANVATGVAAVGAAVLLSSQYLADLTNELSDASTKTGIAISSLAGMRLAAEGSGRSFQGLEQGLIRFQQSIVNAKKPTSEQAKIFKSLGVEIHDTNGELKTADQLFTESTQSLSRMESGLDKNTAIMGLFGRTAGAALVQSGAIDNMQAFSDLAHEFGVDTGPKAIATAAEFQRRMANLGMVSQGSFQRIVDALAGGSGGAGINALLGMTTEAMIKLSVIGSDSLAFIVQGFQDFVGIAAQAWLHLTGNSEAAIALQKRNKSTMDQVAENLENTFVRAGEAVDSYREKVKKTAAAG